MQNLLQEYSVSSQYFAPRGRERIMFLGEQIAQRHLHFGDRLIGIVGDAGSGKSSLIKGMFPGLELSNDDDIVNPRKIMQVRESLEDLKDSGSYHIDMRFQTAFTQMYEIVDFVTNLLSKKRRVIVEHFDLLYPALGINADIMVGIGEEIIVTRPSVFGPLPGSIYEIVHKSLTYRKMAHTAEDVTMQILEEEFNVCKDCYFSSDIRKGFVLKFLKEPDIDLNKLSVRIAEKLALSMPVSYYDENHIQIGDKVVVCDGPRLHVSNTSKILNFSLVKRFIADPKTSTWCLVGLIDNNSEDLENRNTVHFLKRKD
jgi:tRNA A37 threonylcarbamoyladenosine biosynthesis protein TsaE